MIESIRDIGHYEREEGLIPLECMLTEINSNDIKTLLVINIKDDGIEVTTEDFYHDVINEALFYQAGRGFLGGGMRLDFYKENKIKSICTFCEVENKSEEITNIIKDYLEKDKNVFVMIKINDKTPRELFKDKFLNKMYSTMYSKINGDNICHICGAKGQVFNNIAYKFYTNDKGVYSNVEGRGKSGVVICKECLDNIIVGKKYVKDNLTSFWLNKNVMFIPHTYNEDIALIYEDRKLNENGSYTKFIDKIKQNEEEVLEELGKVKREIETDIIFYEEEQGAMNIYHSIKSVLPSRFTFISNKLKYYGNLKLFIIIKYVAVTKVGLDDVESTPKEKMRVIDSIFTGKKIERSLFFKRVMSVYKSEFLKGKHKDFSCMYTINKIYNFLVDCGCLKGGWKVMNNYKNYEELFQDNSEYFDSNEKKAWFIIGKAYNLMNYYIKSKNSSDEGIPQDRTSLDKNFFFARKFNFDDFIYFSNLLNDKAVKYRVDTITFKDMITEAKLYMAKREGRLSQDEAKYLFFFGMDSYFKKEKEDIKEIEDEGKEE